MSVAPREVKDAIPVPLDPLRGVASAVRESMGGRPPASVEVRPRAVT